MLDQRLAVIRHMNRLSLKMARERNCAIPFIDLAVKKSIDFLFNTLTSLLRQERLTA
jgi:hypothetical protein